MSKKSDKKIPGLVVAVLGLAIFAAVGWIWLQEADAPLARQWAAKLGVGDQPTVEGVAWVWRQTMRADGSTVEPKDDSFVLSLIEEEKRVSSTTDCNSLMGSYLLSGDQQLRFGSLAATKMFCQDSMESVYAEQLALVNGYHIDGGRLYLTLDRDFGSMVFEAK